MGRGFAPKKVGPLISGLLLDTHILVRWLAEMHRLSKEQDRVLSQATDRGELLSVSASSLVEIATVFDEGSKRSHLLADNLFNAIEANEGLRIIPIDLAIVREMKSVASTLRDPADRVIVATARVHRMRLVTSDQAIIDSNLVPVVE